jgi:hypothetical protein
LLQKITACCFALHVSLLKKDIERTSA